MLPCQTAQLAGLFATRSLCPAMCMKERLLKLKADLLQIEGQRPATCKWFSGHGTHLSAPDGIALHMPGRGPCMHHATMLSHGTNPAQ